MSGGNKINSIVSTDAQIKITDDHKELAKHEGLEGMVTFAKTNKIQLIDDSPASKFGGLFGTGTSLFLSSVSKHDTKPKLKKYNKVGKRMRVSIGRVSKRTMETRSMTAAMSTGRVLRTRLLVKSETTKVESATSQVNSSRLAAAADESINIDQARRLVKKVIARNN